MSENSRHLVDRREVLKASAGMLGSSLLRGETMEAYPEGVNTNSKPSDLKITDLRPRHVQFRIVLRGLVLELAHFLLMALFTPQH